MSLEGPRSRPGIVFRSWSRDCLNSLGPVTTTGPPSLKRLKAFFGAEQDCPHYVAQGTCLVLQERAGANNLQAVQWPESGARGPKGPRLGGPRASYFPLGTRLPLIGLLPLFP